MPRLPRCQHPAGSFFSSEQREAAKCPIYESFLLADAAQCSGTSELAGRSPPALREHGQPHGEQPGVWDLRPLSGGRKEEEQRDGAAQPRDTYSVTGTWDIGGTVGGTSAAPAPGTAPDISSESRTDT